jgi:hypothetical protein
LILGSDPDAVGVHVALKETPHQLEFSLPTFSLPTFSLPIFSAKSLGHVHSSSASLILGSDPDAVGVHVALKKTPLLFEFFPAHLSLPTFSRRKKLQLLPFPTFPFN